MTTAVRILRRAGAVFGLLLVFALGIVLGAVLHLNTPRARRLVEEKVNQVLAPLFVGRITIEEIGEVHPFGVAGVAATLRDGAGTPVISVHGVSGELALFASLRETLFKRRKSLTLRLSAIEVESLDLLFDADLAGDLVLVDALSPVTVAGASSASLPSDANAGFRLFAPHVSVVHARVHGRPAPSFPVDADLDAILGAFNVLPNAVEVAIARADISVRNLASLADARGALEGSINVPLGTEARPDARIVWAGSVGGIAQTVRASIVRDVVDAVVDVPDAQPRAIRDLWSESPIDQPARIHVEARGALTRLGLAVHAEIGRAILDAEGQLSLQNEKIALISLRARDLDLHQLLAASPPTRLTLASELAADVNSTGALLGRGSLRLIAGTVGATVVPPGRVLVEASRNAQKELRADADLVLDMPAAQARATLHLAPKMGDSLLAVKVRSRTSALEQVPLLGRAVRGALDFSGDGEIDLTHETIVAHARAGAQAVAWAGGQMGQGEINAHASGLLRAPNVDVVVHAHEVVAAGLQFSSVDATALGPVTAPHVTLLARGPDTPELDASADVRLRDGVSLSGVHLVGRRGGERATADIREVEIGGAGIRIDGARVEGLGAPLNATINLNGSSLQGRASTNGIDLGRLARLAHVEGKLHGGTLSFDTRMQLSRASGAGHLLLDAAHVGVGSAKDVSGHLELSIDGRTLKAKGFAASPTVGRIDIDAPKIAVGGAGALSATAWRQSMGAADIDANVDLAQLAALVPAESLPVGEAAGKVAFKAHVERASSRGLGTSLNFTLTTEKLVLAAATSANARGGAPPAWRLAGVDLAVDARIDGEAGLLQVGARAIDRDGPLFQLDATCQEFPYAIAINTPAELLRHLDGAPFDIHLMALERRLESMPALLKQPYVTGRFSLDATARGTLAKPSVNVKADIEDMNAVGSAMTEPVDIAAVASYDGREAKGSASAHSGAKELLNVDVRVEAELLGQQANTPFEWTGSGHAHLESFPLGSIALLDDRGLAGNVSGDLSITDLHKNARADLTLAVDDLSSGGIAYKTATLKFTADGQRAAGDVRIGQATEFLAAHSDIAAPWGKALMPTPDRDQPLAATLSAKSFRVAGLLPILGGVLDELDGRLDADAKIEADPHANGARLEGRLQLSGATVEATAGGGVIHDINAKVKLSPDGTVTLEQFRASGMTGRIEASGTAHIDGTRVKSASAIVTIPSQAPVPVSADGFEIGNVDGRFELGLNTESNGATILKVEVPKLHVQLPETGSQDAQSLGPMANVRVGARRGDSATLTPLSLDSSLKSENSSGNHATVPLRIDTHLRDVQVARGAMVKVFLDGDLTTTLGSTTKVTGNIQLKPGGTLEVQGRTFALESGTIAFVGDDPSNPQVVAKAGWTGPDGTLIYASFTGPLKTGKVTLSSEPALPNEEIVELLLFGTTDGRQTASQGVSAGAVAGVAGGQATQPLNHLFGQLGLGAVTTKIDATSVNPKPEVELQIARDLSLQLAALIGNPPPGVNPDTALLTLDWRFLSRWSLATTVGNKGSAILDLLWQKRY